MVMIAGSQTFRIWAQKSPRIKPRALEMGRVRASAYQGRTWFGTSAAFAHVTLGTVDTVAAIE